MEFSQWFEIHDSQFTFHWRFKIRNQIRYLVRARTRKFRDLKLAYRNTIRLTKKIILSYLNYLFPLFLNTFQHPPHFFTRFSAFWIKQVLRGRMVLKKRRELRPDCIIGPTIIENVLFIFQNVAYNEQILSSRGVPLYRLRPCLYGRKSARPPRASPHPRDSG